MASDTPFETPANLPAEFVSEMTRLWLELDPPGELQTFLRSFEEMPQSGLNPNTLKLKPGEQAELFPPLDGKVAWTENGYYLPADHQAGRHPYHAAGLYYLQDPSAMLPAAAAAVRPGERVLDLCAAPGGKAAAMAYGMADSGLLWVNEINPKRARVLLKNMELSGTFQAVVTQSEPQHLAALLPRFFDCIMLDVPCSGSGMLRRDMKAKHSWQKYQTDEMLELQSFLIDQARLMLKPGGRLIYSTCSFSAAENEMQIDQAVRRHSDLRIEPIRLPGLSPGLKLPQSAADTSAAVRIWPHQQRGEGHFCALLVRTAEPDGQGNSESRETESDPITADIPRKIRMSKGKGSGRYRSKELQLTEDHPYYASFAQFCGEAFRPEFLQSRIFNRAYRLRLQENHLHLLPAGWELPDAANYLKTGVMLGQFILPKRHRDGHRLRADQLVSAVRFEPAHGILLACSAEAFRNRYRAQPDDLILAQYLRGESPLLPPDFPADWPEQTWGALLAGNYPLGWAIRQGAVLKNKYPRGWFSFL